MLVFSFLIAIVHAAAFYEIRPRATWDLRQPVMMFDLDNTLYSYSDYDLNNRRLSVQYLHERRGMEALAAERLLNSYRLKYDGVAARGIAQDLGLDASDYERYVDARSNIPRMVRPDPRLNAMLGNMKARLYVLTNSGLEHALMVLKARGILHHFHGIIYIDYGKRLFTTKPDAQVYRDAMRFSMADRPSNVFFLDDNLPYARGAKDVGWNAYYLDAMGRSRVPNFNFPSMRSIYDLPRAIPALF